MGIEYGNLNGQLVPFERSEPVFAYRKTVVDPPTEPPPTTEYLPPVPMEQKKHKGPIRRIWFWLTISSFIGAFFGILMPTQMMNIWFGVALGCLVPYGFMLFYKGTQQAIAALQGSLRALPTPQEAYNDLSAQLGRPATLEEVNAFLGMHEREKREHQANLALLGGLWFLTRSGDR